MENKWSIKGSQHYKAKGNMHFLTQSEVASASVLIHRKKAKSDSSGGKGSWASFVYKTGLLLLFSALSPTDGEAAEKATNCPQLFNY